MSRSFYFSNKNNFIYRHDFEAKVFSIQFNFGVKFGEDVFHVLFRNDNKMFIQVIIGNVFFQIIHIHPFWDIINFLEKE